MARALQKVVERGVAEHELTLLLRRTAGGDQTALAELYDGTSHLVYGLALRIVGDAGEAEEVTLDVYEQVWRQAADYNARRGTPMAWLLMLTRSRAIDRLRTAKRQRHREDPIDFVASLSSLTASPEEDAIMADQRRRVQLALADLRPEQREAIELAYFHGLSQSEIAETLQQPLGTVKTRIRLGMMKLREWLTPLQEGLTT